MGKGFGGRHVAIEENEPEETRVSGVSRREDNTLNRGTYKRVREIYDSYLHNRRPHLKFHFAPLFVHKHLF